MIGVRHSPQDMGRAADLFDGNKETLLRGQSANPLVIELRFAQPRSIRSISLDLAAMSHFRVKVEVRSTENIVTSFMNDFVDLSAAPHVDLPLGAGQQNVAILRIEIEDVRPQPAEGYHIHAREVQIR